MSDLRPLPDWTRPEVRALLTVGMILEDDDCGYLRVDAITPEGVIAPTIFGPQLWTWVDLTRTGCTVWKERESVQSPSPPPAAPPPPTYDLMSSDADREMAQISKGIREGGRRIRERNAQFHREQQTP